MPDYRAHKPALCSDPIASIRARVVPAAILAIALIVACGETEEPDVSVGPVGTNTGTATPGAVPGTDAGLTPASPTGPGATITPARDAGGPSTTATTTTPPSGASTDTQWCKVKTLLDKNCVACHTTPAVAGAPFPLTTHAELTAAHPTKPGKKIYERVGLRVHADKSQAEGLVVMPPGKALPAADIALIDAWVAAGAPAGDNPSCTPPAGVTPTTDAGVATQEWPLKECDAVYKLVAHGSGGLNTPAIAAAGRETHPQVPLDAPWGDEQVQAIAFKTITDNAKVLHHWILSGRPGGFLTGWAPGEDGIKRMRDDVGMMMPTGKGSLNLDMHYYNTMGTKDEQDRSGVEVCVVKKEHFRKNNAAVATRLVAIMSIPPNATNYEAKSSCTVSSTSPVTFLSASPHAHKLAVRMLFTVKKKNGQTITMHDMPFMFGEQKSYPLDPPVVVESGDVVTTSCFFNNPSNRTVTFGESTSDEMCFNFALYYPAGGLSCGAGGSGALGGAGGFIGGN